MRASKHSRLILIWRQWRASWRDTALLLRQFGAPLAFFVLVVVGGGAAYYILSIQAGEPVDSVAEAVYLALSLVFLQSPGEFPRVWYLQVFYFALPVLGLGALAQGLADFGVALFNRRARSREWEMAVASTYSGHVVLVGLGHLGYRVMKQLREMNQDVVVIELNPDADLVTTVRNMGVTILHDDARREAALRAAGVPRARTIVLCPQNDALNLQIALKARSMNPAIQVIVRIFDDDFAEALQNQFNFRALSATSMAAPAFAAAAVGVDVTRPITVEGQPLSFAQMRLGSHSVLLGKSITELEQRYDLSIVFWRRGDEFDFHPAPDRRLAAQDAIAVVGRPDSIHRIIQDI
ncbi:MAG: NAD-binding protein [Anaerolineae bacterium]|nr:NAD-binding protein [Thermoflexales bacterium]MDW8406168.1 NAD-binding protein [Anaerolineae bacterium]